MRQNPEKPARPASQLASQRRGNAPAYSQNRPRVDHPAEPLGQPTESEFRFSLFPPGFSIPSIEQLPPIELRARFLIWFSWTLALGCLRVLTGSGMVGGGPCRASAEAEA